MEKNGYAFASGYRDYMRHYYDKKRFQTPFVTQELLNEYLKGIHAALDEIRENNVKTNENKEKTECQIIQMEFQDLERS